MNIDNLNLCANLYAVYHVYKNNGYSRRPFAMGVVGPLSGLGCNNDSPPKVLSYGRNFPITTVFPAYSDTLGTREKCHCKQVSL